MKLSYPLAILAMVGVAFALPASSVTGETTGVSATPETPAAPAVPVPEAVKPDTTVPEAKKEEAKAEADEATKKATETVEATGAALEDGAKAAAAETKQTAQSAKEKAKDLANKGLDKAGKGVDSAKKATKDAGRSSYNFIKSAFEETIKNLKGNAKWQNEGRFVALKKKLPAALALIGTYLAAVEGAKHLSAHRADIRIKVDSKAV